MACVGIRYLIIFMVFLAFALDAGSRSSMSIVIIAMVNNTIGPHHDLTSVFDPLRTESLDWDSITRGWVLNSVYVGMLISQLPAGHLAESFSLKWVLGYGIFFMSLINFVAPFIAKWNAYAFIATRVLSGLSVGVIFPSANSLITRWSPLQERTLMMTLALQGWCFGPIVSSVLTGIICETWGWEYVFYSLGAVGVVWSICWYFIVASSPEKHWWITEEEKMKILEEREGNFDRNRHIPWPKILTSFPVFVLCLRTFAVNLFYAVYFSYVPTFLANTYTISLSQVGWINGISNVATSIVAMISSALADKLLAADYSINVVRKSFATLSTVGPSVLCVAMLAVEGSFKLMLILLIATCVIWGAYGGSDTALPMDLAPEYAGAVSALQNVYSNLALIVVPIVVGWFTEEKADVWHWNIIFTTVSILNLIGAIFFLVFGTAERQDWSTANLDEDEEALVDPL